MAVRYARFLEILLNASLRSSSRAEESPGSARERQQHHSAGVAAQSNSDQGQDPGGRDEEAQGAAATAWGGHEDPIHMTPPGWGSGSGSWALDNILSMDFPYALGMGMGMGNLGDPFQLLDGQLGWPGLWGFGG